MYTLITLVLNSSYLQVGIKVWYRGERYRVEKHKAVLMLLVTYQYSNKGHVTYIARA